MGVKTMSLLRRCLTALLCAVFFAGGMVSLVVAAARLPGRD